MVAVYQSACIVQRKIFGQNWQRLLKILFSVALPVSIAVTLLFWVLLSPTLIFTNSKSSTWDKAVSSFDHLIQFLMAAGEIIISSILLDWIYILAPVLFILYYSILGLILKLTTDLWPYGFMYSFFGTTEINYLNFVLFLVGTEILIAVLFIITKYLRQLAHARFVHVETAHARIEDQPFLLV
jgi:hypothetical protein